MTFCVLSVLNPASVQAAAVGPKEHQQPAPTPAGPEAAAAAAQVPWSACRLWDPNPIFASLPKGAQATEPQQQHLQPGKASHLQGD